MLTYIDQTAASVVYFKKLLKHKYVVKTFQTCLYDCVASNCNATVYAQYIPARLTGGFVGGRIVALAQTNHCSEHNYNYVSVLIRGYIIKNEDGIIELDWMEFVSLLAMCCSTRRRVVRMRNLVKFGVRSQMGFFFDWKQITDFALLNIVQNTLSLFPTINPMK